MQSEVVHAVCCQLGIPEYAARTLLSSYGNCLLTSVELLSLSSIGWSAELVIDAFKKDSAAACQKAGIDLQQLQGI